MIYYKYLPPKHSGEEVESSMKHSKENYYAYIQVPNFYFGLLPQYVNMIQC